MGSPGLKPCWFERGERARRPPEVPPASLPRTLSARGGGWGLREQLSSPRFLCSLGRPPTAGPRAGCWLRSPTLQPLAPPPRRRWLAAGSVAPALCSAGVSCSRPGAPVVRVVLACVWHHVLRAVLGQSKLDASEQPLLSTAQSCA